MWDGVDRRKFLRVDYPCLIKVQKHSPSPSAILTHTKDISEGGVRVIIRKRLEIMTDVDLEIDLMDTLPNVISDGTISWVKKIPSSRKGKPPYYDTGIQFISLRDKYRRRIKKILERILDKST